MNALRYIPLSILVVFLRFHQHQHSHQKERKKKEKEGTTKQAKAINLENFIFFSVNRLAGCKKSYAVSLA